MDKPPLVVYDYTRSRAQTGPMRWLEGYRGYLHADAYGGYDVLYANQSLLEVGCWGHARRKFHEATIGVKTPGRAHCVLAQIRQLAKIEQHMLNLPQAQRKHYRRRKAKPILKTLRQWLLANLDAVVPKSPLGKAIRYALSNWRALTRYVKEDYLTLINNIAERHMRNVALGRKK